MLALVLLGLHGCASSAAEAWYNMGVRAHSLDSKIFRYTKAIGITGTVYLIYAEIEVRAHDVQIIKYTVPVIAELDVKPT